MKKFDALILGSGQAGTPLAFHLAEAGKRVAIVEKSHYGGTCVNDGCTPTKAYVASAKRIWDAKNAGALGIDIPSGIKADLKAIKQRKDQLVESSREGIKSGISDNKQITSFYGKATFVDYKTVAVNGIQIQAEQVFINVGGRPRIPDGITAASPLTNTSILQLETLPEHLIIAGGGYIGLEFGQMFHRFGSKVTILEKKDRLLSREDPEVSQAIQEILENEGIEIRLNADCISAKKEGEQVVVQVHCDEGEPEVHGSHLLAAMGRVPNTDDLGLEATRLKTDEQGYIRVNDHCETSEAGIFALGDCNGEGAFTHTSYHDFQVVKDYLSGYAERGISDRITTYGLFTDPPLGRVGMTLAEARQEGIPVLYNDMPMSKVARAKEKGETRGFMRIICREGSGQILGAHVLGTGGDEVISTLTAMMYGKLPYQVLRDSVQIHPTVSELLPTLLEGLKKDA